MGKEGTPEDIIDDEESEEETQIIDIGVQRAQEIAREQGLKIGETVAHPSDRIIYALKEIEGNNAHVWIPGEEDSIKTFPLNELFNPNVAKREALQENSIRMGKKIPQINN